MVITLFIHIQDQGQLLLIPLELLKLWLLVVEEAAVVELPMAEEEMVAVLVDTFQQTMHIFLLVLKLL